MGLHPLIFVSFPDLEGKNIRNSFGDGNIVEDAFIIDEHI